MCSGVQMLTSQGCCCKGTLNVSLSASWITDLLLGKSLKSSLSQNSHLRQWVHGICLVINWAPAVVWHSVNWVMVTAPESLPSTLQTKIQQGWEDNEEAWAGAGFPDLALHFGLEVCLKGRGATANTTGHCCAVKGRFWGSFSREAKTDEVPSMSSLSKEICGPLGLGAAVCCKGLLCTVLFQDFPVWRKVTVWLTSTILNPWGSIAWWQGRNKTTTDTWGTSQSLTAALWSWLCKSGSDLGKALLQGTDVATVSVTLGQVAGAHPALIRLTLVLVTHEGHRKKPRERRCTDGLLRWRRVWREQELWIVLKEATARWGSVKSFHRWIVTLLGGVSRLTGSHRTQLPFFFSIRSKAGLRVYGCFFLTYSQGFQTNPNFLFLPFHRQLFLLILLQESNVSGNGWWGWLVSAWTLLSVSQTYTEWTVKIPAKPARKLWKSRDPLIYTRYKPYYCPRALSAVLHEHSALILPLLGRRLCLYKKIPCKEMQNSFNIVLALKTTRKNQGLYSRITPCSQPWSHFCAMDRYMHVSPYPVAGLF